MQAKSTVKAGQGLAAAPHGEIHVLLQDKHGCLVKDYPNVQVKLELKLVDTSDDSDRVQLSQSGVAGAYALATATEGVAVFKDIVVTGMDLHSLDACLLPRSVDFSFGQLPVRGPVLAVSAPTKGTHTSTTMHSSCKSQGGLSALAAQALLWSPATHTHTQLDRAITGHKSRFTTLVALTCLTCRYLDNQCR